MKVTQKLLEILNKYSNFPIDADFFLLNTSESIQKKLAPILRLAAIDNLRHGKGVVANAFRGEYIASGLGHFKNFLAAQEKNGAWGTDIEAASIGELLGLKVVATPEKAVEKNKIVRQTPIVLYRTEDDSAPVLQLFNRNNNHWYAVTSDQTLGDNNCLYNALAEDIQKIVIQELLPPAISISKQSFFSKDDNTAIQSQAAALLAIQMAPKPSEIEQQLKEEKKRFDSYPSEVQNQIKEQIEIDYKLALKLAREEMHAFHQSNFVLPDYEQYLSHPIAAAA